MPIFDFICRNCGGKFETLILNSKEKVVCIDCGSNNVDKLYSIKFGIRKASSSNSFEGVGEDSMSSGSSRCGSCISKSCSTCF